MNDKEKTSVYFLGIGGIGMSALARYFHREGIRVAGYDKVQTPLTDELSREGIEVHFEEEPGKIPVDTGLVIRTPAVPEKHKEYLAIQERGIPVRKRAEVLGEITSVFRTIAVAGTHGKTTISSMIAHIMYTAGKEFLAFLGGIPKNYGTNFITNIEASTHYGRADSLLATSLTTSPSDPDSYRNHQFTSSPYCVVEADEYDRSFLHLSPDIAIITSVDPDHLDVYDHHDKLVRSFEEFTRRIRDNGSLVIKAGITIRQTNHTAYNRFTYALNTESNFYAKNIFIREGLIHFDFVTPTETIPDFVLGLPGMFNLENMVAAMATGYLLGIDIPLLRKSVESYQGVRRRFDIRIRRRDFIYIDDYAHHPVELKACIHAVRELYPGKKVTGIFQPHLFTRTRDLSNEFASALDDLDRLIMLDIYPARENPIKGVSSKMLLEKVSMKEKILCKPEEVIGILKSEQPEVVLTLGAGDIDKLAEPITEAFG